MPQHWQPNSGNVMANDLSGNNPEEAVPCIALSKNDSYVMSACGGKVSLFNMMTFKVNLIALRDAHSVIILVLITAAFSFVLSGLEIGHDNLYAAASCFNLFSIPSTRQ